MKNTVRITLLCVTVTLFSLVLAACTELAGTQAPVLPTSESGEATQAITAEPTQAGLSEPAPSLDTQQVLAACPTGSQTTAMRPGYDPGWEALDLSACYELEFDLSLDPPGYTGSARVTYANQTGQEVPDLVFRLYPNAERIYGGELQVTSAHVDGIPVDGEVFLHDRTALRLPLENSLPPGEIAVVELEFSGMIPMDREGLPGVYGIFNYDSSGEVLVLANGYPILATWEEGGWRTDPVVGIGDAVVSETALYHVRVAAPPGWQVVATGAGLEQETSGERTSLEFVTGPVREFTLVASPNFVARQAEINGVQVHHWGLPDGEDRWEDALQAAVDSITLFDEHYGPYPYIELDVVAVPLWLAAGVEYPGLILLRQALYQPGPDSSPSLEYVVAHEVAHQWWYAVVGNDVLEHPWQDEALATFSGLLYLEEHQQEAYAGTLQFYRGRVADLESGEGHTGIAQPVEAFQDNPSAYSPVVYIKGSLFYAELREQLGDETFFRALQTYYAQNKYRRPPPQVLLDSFEQACACALDTIYQEWGVK
jgi:hypothetical protein